MNENNRKVRHLDHIFHQADRLYICSILAKAEGEVEARSLIRAVGLHRSELSRNMTILKEKGYVLERRQNPSDGRRVQYHLTPSGRLAYDTYRSALREILDLSFEPMEAQ